MEFCFVGDFVYINNINKLQYEENKRNRSCITGDNLCTDCRQHLSRWIILPSTSKSTGTNSKQELLEQEKGNCIPQRVTKSVTESISENVKTWVYKRLGLFYYPSV
jgi:hypothetical protein